MFVSFSYNGKNLMSVDIDVVPHVNEIIEVTNDEGIELFVVTQVTHRVDARKFDVRTAVILSALGAIDGTDERA